MGKSRLKSLPNVPTIAEAGYPGFEAENWFGAFVPAGTPHNITTQLNREIVKIIASPDMRERWAALGFEPIGSPPEEFAEQISVELDKWGGLIRAANIKS
jgi:tripartite-type tricarboxylate transporter receptor subunit TctC